MRVLIINGSPRSKGITATVLHMIEEKLREEDIEVDFCNLGEIKMSHCSGCNLCYKTGHCYMDDDAEKLSYRIEKSDGIVFGSPTYASNVSGIMKDFIDRGHFVIEQLLLNKYCITVATGENYGNKDTMKVLNNLVLFSGGRLSGKLLIKAPFNDVKSITKIKKMYIEKVLQRFVNEMKQNRLYFFQRVFHFLVFNIGIKPFVTKKGDSYRGVMEKWKKLGI